MKKILLVGDTWPSNENSSSIAVKKFIQSISDYCEVSTFIIRNRKPNDVPPESIGLGEHFYLTGPEQNWTGPRFLRKCLTPFISLFTMLEIDHIKKLLQKILRKFDFDHVVFVLQGQVLILLSDKVISKELEYSTISWDPWIWWSTEHALPKKIDIHVRNSLVNIYKGGVHLVPTLNFAVKNQIDAQRARIIYWPEVAAVQNYRRTLLPSRLNIVFAGASYAKKELQFFIKNLEKIDWKFNEKVIFLHLIGPSFNIANANIIHHRRMNYADLPDFLARFDVGFLPYPCQNNILAVSEQSFPSKVSGYASAGLPIIYLGPVNAPVLSVISDFVFVLEFDEREILNLKDTFEKIISQRLKLKEEALSSYFRNFSYQAFDHNLFSWGVSVGLFKEVQRPHILSEEKLFPRPYKKVGNGYFGTLVLRKLQVLLSPAFFRFIFHSVKTMIFYSVKTGVSIYVYIWQIRTS